MTRFLQSFIVTAMFLVACSRGGDFPDGVIFIAPLGKPPINYMIWSPNSMNEILITAAYLQPGNASVYTLNILTKKKHTILETEGGHLWAKNWLPGGKELIVFVSPGTVGFESGGYWKININNNSMEPIDASAAGEWSPDGKKRAFGSHNQNPNSARSGIAIHVIDNETNVDEIVYSETGSEILFGLSWSRGSDKLIFSSGDYSSTDLKILDLRTHTAKQLTDGDININPVWSPTEDLIAYMASENGVSYQLHFVRPDGSCDIEFRGVNDARSLTWSPDGKKLGFVVNDGIYYLETDEILAESFSPDRCR